MQCGQLIRVKLDRSLNKLNKIEYNSLYFQVGMTIYTEEIGLEQCIQEFHTQSHIPLSNHCLQIFCYKMDNKIQNQLKNYHYIQAIASFCKSLNISEDIQREIISFM